MAKLSRRQILLAGFFAGAGVSIASSHWRDQRKDSEFDQEEGGADIAYETGISAEKIRQIEQSVALQQPLIPYNRQISKLLVRCCRLATEQYLQGVADPEYDGAIASLVSYFPQLNNYQQIIAFKAIRERSWLEPLMNQTFLRDLIPQTEFIYHGFILKSARHNIIVFRGTQEPREWIANINAQQIEYLSDNKQAGKIHQGFYSLYVNNLAQQIRQVIDQLDPNIPCYITGHSLGGTMTVIAAVDLAVHFPAFAEQLLVYSYASPRVGDPYFARFYSDLVPNSYRIVNQADSTWLLPPTQLRNAVYLHVGQTWSFINQTGDLNPNHQLAAYQAAIDQEVEIHKSPITPMSGF
ncbi:putative lipase [Xenococcus sp. PCC 7305]|uniref:lipase family protein n=1 Tax=Xenococcus sp. PCC 7305 TaxID=102125 RepID=UPI0002ABC612|nr:lipase family protein [Xenococcus sp. PCC 7305]ELS00946.1 putative lipase [Xenococcus sp. PCC 7305]